SKSGSLIINPGGSVFGYRGGFILLDQTQKCDDFRKNCKLHFFCLQKSQKMKVFLEAQFLYYPLLGDVRKTPVSKIQI
ncbi:MAG: hypothetical protein ACYDBV_11805, partial [Nitrospiria bacterium]